jgi:hypothetical protein
LALLSEKDGQSDYMNIEEGRKQIERTIRYHNFTGLTHLPVSLVVKTKPMVA